MKTVFNYFEEIMSIPRESGKEGKIANYIINYAKNNNLEYSLGKNNTVFIKKNNNSDKTIILQAHSDMVCVSKNNYDFDNKGIPYYIDEDYYKAKNTSLGADDGIGVAIILAILQEKDNMPNIEVIITTQEETTMLGAMNFDYSKITSNTLISLDGIKEGDIESSSAGMCSIEFNRKVNYIDTYYNCYKLTINGLAGGHSGDDISKNRINAIKLAIELLKKFNSNSICDISFGSKDNVIPSEGYISFTSDKTIDELNNIIREYNYNLIDDDKNLKINIEKIELQKSIIDSNNITDFIDNIKSGLIEVFEDDNFPLFSANIGAVILNNDEMNIKYSIRSSDIEKENKYIDELKDISRKYNFDMNIIAKKPFFAFKKNSEIRNILFNTYRTLYGKNAVIRKVHACMEGGILSENIPNLDICTIAPTISNCHSVNECVSISSTKRVYEWLKQALIKYNSE